MTYDALGKCRIRKNGNSYTWWRWDVGWNVTAGYDDPDMDWDVENLAMTYIPGVAEIAGSDPSSGTYRYYSEDHLGSVRRMRDGDKASLASYEYGAGSGLAIVHFGLVRPLEPRMMRGQPRDGGVGSGLAITHFGLMRRLGPRITRG
jgi:hypothetical protein